MRMNMHGTFWLHRSITLRHEAPMTDADDIETRTVTTLMNQQHSLQV